MKENVFTLQKLLPHLNDGASVLFTSSTVAKAVNLGTSVYSATKGAVNKIAQIAANELAGRKVRVKIVIPGLIKTEGLEKVVTTDEGKNYLPAATAMQRLGNPDEIAKTVLFLASDDASFITGTELLVDGGYTTFAKK